MRIRRQADGQFSLHDAWREGASYIDMTRLRFSLPTRSVCGVPLSHVDAHCQMPYSACTCGGGAISLGQRVSVVPDAAFAEPRSRSACKQFGQKGGEMKDAV
jgi:hypothetical protein